MISLTPYASRFPVEVEPEEYEHLVRQNQNGWSACNSEKEWLAKLHYLRQGRKEGKIEEAAFKNRETALILNWWRKSL
ncbi:MAG: hypothetical protein HQM13_15885 [SAR324 cluster bacterium]|nr:hypothetical protein [SAR324 cluster bacterium]